MRRRPIILGIVGDSAAGKTTLTKGIARILGPERVTHVCTDDYHRYDRRERAELGITALHPDCNYIDILEQHIERLHYGLPILKPKYDHATGTLVRPEYVVPREFVIVEGLLAFHTPVLRSFMDVKVFLDPPEPLRHRWKIARDTTKRGYTEAQVLAELAKREPDSRAFIRPQREFADIVVRFQPAEGMRAEDPNARLDVRVVLRPTLRHPDLSYLVEGGAATRDGVRLTLARDAGRPVDFLEIDGNVSPPQAAALEAAIWQHLPALAPLDAQEFGAYVERGQTRHSDHLALTQLLLAYHLLRSYADPALTVAPPVALASGDWSPPLPGAAAPAPPG